MDQIELKVNKRETLGKKVRFLRRQGITPVNLFGHGIESVSLQCDTARLQRVLTEAGKTRLISLKFDNEREARPAVISGVQAEPRTGGLLHVDFHQVRMAEAVKVKVPIVLVGEAPALKSKDNMLVQELNALTVECLPAQIPPSVELDLSSLTETEQAVRVKDIELGKEVTILNGPELVVVKISLRPVEKIEEEVVVEGEIEAPEAAPQPEEGPKEE